MSHHQLDLEMTIRRMCDGILNSKRDKGLYISLDMGIVPDTDKCGLQRDVRVGVHLLRYGDTMYGYADHNFLGREFSKLAPWRHVSSHDSCWASSTGSFVDEIERDVYTKKGKSQYVAPYKEDKLKFSKDYNKHRTYLFIQTITLVDKSQIEGMVYINRHSDDPRDRHVVYTG